MILINPEATINIYASLLSINSWSVNKKKKKRLKTDQSIPHVAVVGRIQHGKEVW
jgi:hypothetical protein